MPYVELTVLTATTSDSTQLYAALFLGSTRPPLAQIDLASSAIIAKILCEYMILDLLSISVAGIH